MAICIRVVSAMRPIPARFVAPATDYITHPGHS
jgi:hypothetical protein